MLALDAAVAFITLEKKKVIFPSATSNGARNTERAKSIQKNAPKNHFQSVIIELMSFHCAFHFAVDCVFTANERYFASASVELLK